MSLQYQLIAGGSAFAMVYLLILLHRKQTLASWEKLRAETNRLDNKLIKDVKLKYVINNGGKLLVSILNRADIQIFDGFVLIYRRQGIFFQLYFKPILICKVSEQADSLPDVQELLVLQEIKIERFRKGEVEMSCFEKKYTWRTSVLSFTELTEEQIKDFASLRAWV